LLWNKWRLIELEWSRVREYEDGNLEDLAGYGEPMVPESHAYIFSVGILTEDFCGLCTPKSCFLHDWPLSLGWSSNFRVIFIRVPDFWVWTPLYGIGQGWKWETWMIPMSHLLSLDYIACKVCWRICRCKLSFGILVFKIKGQIVNVLNYD